MRDITDCHLVLTLYFVHAILTAHLCHTVQLSYDIDSVRTPKDKCNVLTYFETDIGVVPCDRFAENAFV